MIAQTVQIITEKSVAYSGHAPAWMLPVVISASLAICILNIWWTYRRIKNERDQA